MAKIIIVDIDAVGGRMYVIQYLNTVPVSGAVRIVLAELQNPESQYFYSCNEFNPQEGSAQAHIQALNLTEGMCAPAMAWLA
jgi:hypothetical protein